MVASLSRMSTASKECNSCRRSLLFFALNLLEEVSLSEGLFDAGFSLSLFSLLAPDKRILEEAHVTFVILCEFLPKCTRHISLSQATEVGRELLDCSYIKVFYIF